MTAPDMVSIIQAALVDSWDDTQWPPEEMARAVLAAISEAGTVEWGTGEGSALMTWRDRGQAERQSASATKSYDRGETWVHTNPPVVSRVTFPWERAE